MTGKNRESLRRDQRHGTYVEDRALGSHLITGFQGANVRVVTDTEQYNGGDAIFASMLAEQTSATRAGHVNALANLSIQASISDPSPRFEI